MPYTVELLRHRHGEREAMDVDFQTQQAALEYAREMLITYKYRVWVDGVEYTRKDFS